MLEEITVDMTRRSQLIFDIRPFDDATVQHVLYTRLPIPSLPLYGSILANRVACSILVSLFTKL